MLTTIMGWWNRSPNHLTGLLAHDMLIHAFIKFNENSLIVLKCINVIHISNIWTRHCAFACEGKRRNQHLVKNQILVITTYNTIYYWVDMSSPQNTKYNLDNHLNKIPWLRVQPMEEHVIRESPLKWVLMYVKWSYGWLKDKCNLWGRYNTF